MPAATPTIHELLPVACSTAGGVSHIAMEGEGQCCCWVTVTGPGHGVMEGCGLISVVTGRLGAATDVLETA